ncbi:hypothetical protein L1987_57663 [Smallanthus sonchifolius]|uniref:Uncharacterized protein n=1 Tax=Smallanthus sonchifolius TaxID=185202 RepID=A0ACB9DD37_9ASTR|nr:hypothetical protein L1987_57663 [Smallanthus sonchifolius]
MVQQEKEQGSTMKIRENESMEDKAIPHLSPTIGPALHNTITPPTPSRRDDDQKEVRCLRLLLHHHHRWPDAAVGSTTAADLLRTPPAAVGCP